VEEHNGGHESQFRIGVTRALAVNEAGEIARKRVERLVNEFRVLITSPFYLIRIPNLCKTEKKDLIESIILQQAIW